MEFQPLEMPPINIRAKYYAFRKEDSAFAANARLLQSIWRQNHYGDEVFGTSNYGKKWGYLIPIEMAKKDKTNFFTERIYDLVENRIKFGKGLIQEPRIWNNLLSSQPLCFNLFGELSFDKNLATQLFQRLFPNKILEINDIFFEYLPQEKPLNDHTAFDVFITYISPTKKKGFIGIEVKYSEDLTAEPATIKKEYIETTIHSQLFKSDSVEQLKKSPLEQVWRDHLLCLSMLSFKDRHDEGFFVFLYPEKNEECCIGVNQYQQTFVNPESEENKFYSITLEGIIKVLKELDTSQWIIDFENRYLHFEKIDLIIGEDRYWEAEMNSWAIERTFEQALNYFNKAIQNDPYNVRAYYLKEQTLQKLTRYDKVVICCDKLISLYENDKEEARRFFPDVYFDKQEALFKLDRYGDALKVIQKILQEIKEDDFDHIDKCIGLGEIYIEKGMLKEAYSLGKSLMKFSESKDAIKFIEKTTSLVESQGIEICSGYGGRISN